MCKVIAVSCSKGGVGKTTSAVNIGIGLAYSGRRVLLLDVDGQGDLSKSLGVEDPETLDYTIARAMVAVANGDDADPREGILTHDEGVDFLPANSRLSVLDKDLGSIPGSDTVLKDLVECLKDDYDYILLDSKPAHVALSVNVLAASDYVLIPVLSEYLPGTDIEQTVMGIRLVQRRLNKKLKIGGIFFTMVDDRTLLSKEVEKQIRDAYIGNVRIFDTKIPRSVRVAESAALGESIFRHDPNGKAAMAYAALTREVLNYE